jgi:hypothetical protein
MESDTRSSAVGKQHLRRAAVAGLARIRAIAARRRMWLRVGQGLATLAMLAVVGLGLLMLRLSDSPLSVAFLTPRIVDAVQQQLPAGYHVTIEDTVIERDRDTLDLVLRLRDVAVNGPDGNAVFAAPRAAIGLSGLALATGRIAPSSVWLIRPRMNLRQVDGGLRFQTASPEAETAESFSQPPRSAPLVAPVEAFAVLFALLGNENRRGLSTFGVRDARVSVFDEAGGRHDIDNVELVVSRGVREGEIAFAVGIGAGAGMPSFEGQARRSVGGGVILTGGIRNLAIADLEPLLPKQLPFVMTSPISADFSLTVGVDGDLDRLSSEVMIGAGHVGVGEHSFLIDEADIAVDWRYSTGTIVIRPSRLLAGETGFRMTGQIAVPERGDFSYGTIPLKLDFSDISIADPNGDLPSRYNSVTLEGFLVPDQRFLHVSRLDLISGQTAGSFVGFIGGRGETPGVKLAGSVTDMTVDTLKSAWPAVVAPKARRWAVRNLVSGDILDARINVDIQPEEIASALRGVPLPQGAFDLAFRARDVSFRYLGDLPPMVGVAATGRVDGQRFDVRLTSEARIELPDGGVLRVAAGRFEVPDIPSKPSTGIVEMRLEGKLRDAVVLLDQPPVDFATSRGMNVDDFEGDGRFDIRVTIPFIDDLRFPDIALQVDGRIEDFAASNFAGARRVNDGDVDLRIEDGRISIAGTAELDGVRAAVAVEDPLLPGGEPGARSVTMTLDEDARRRLGLPLDDILSGPIVATVSDVRATADGTSQHIHADLTKARIGFAALGVEKPAGEQATADFVLAQTGNTVRLTDLKLVSNSLRVEGSAEFEKGGGLTRISLPVLRSTRGTDISVDGRTLNGVQNVSLTGKTIDLRGALADLRGGAGGGVETGSGGMRIDVDVERAIGAGGVTLANLSGTVARTGGRVTRLELSATGEGGAPISLRHSDDGTNADLTVESADAGSTLGWSGVYPNMRGGRLRLAASRRGANAPVAGTIDVDRFRIANDPSLANLIEGGERQSRGRLDSAPVTSSQQQGLNVSDVGFDRLSASFQRNGPTIWVTNGVLRGVAVGATVEGSLDLAAKRLAIHGTYVPLYALNNLFGQLPLFLGPLLGGKPNEGLLGITYSVSGTMDAPVLTINPISVVAPGVFRYIFGMDNPRAAVPRTATDTIEPLQR